MTFRTIHTRLGLIALAQAEATGTPINLTQMAVGDGLGNDITPDEGQTGLYRECYRAAVNRVFQSPTNPGRFSAELIVPASAAGFTLREVGIFDSFGNLFAVGNLPATYKPATSEGAYADTVVRLEFMVSNASAITLQVDPNVAVATQSWVSNNVTAKQIIPGGTSTQFLGKNSNLDGDYQWRDIAGVNVVVNTIEETQTLAGGQTVVTWGTVTTDGLAIYINGERLRADEWTKDPIDHTKCTLAHAYSDGDKIVGAQNEPAGALVDPLAKFQNLADVPDKGAARNNLDVFSRAESKLLAPASQIAYFSCYPAPSGWLKANGAAISRTAYADLYAAIGTYYGTGDGFTTFNIPDLRGEFVRGLDDGRGLDPGRGTGTIQGSQNLTHSHDGNTYGAGDHSHAASMAGAGGHSHAASSETAGYHGHNASTSGAGGHDHGLQNYKGVDADIRRPIIPGAEISAAGNGALIRTDSVGDHSHGVSIEGNGAHQHSIGVAGVGDHAHNITINGVGGHAHGFVTNFSGGGEARPRNMALLACIKY